MPLADKGRMSAMPKRRGRLFLTEPSFGHLLPIPPLGMIRFLAIVLACLIALPFGGAYEHAHAETDRGSATHASTEFVAVTSDDDVDCCTHDETSRTTTVCGFAFDVAVGARNVARHNVTALKVRFGAHNERRYGLAPSVPLDPPRLV